ncbi:hypothetical protein O3M35_007431 [Rhynocoris fuscipes]|uniref:DOMON domain-containing protein n=1 Tax=Rhynocoris fuscipes TaxID=488301 RepID=A0AAW1DA84_9HEMI
MLAVTRIYNNVHYYYSILFITVLVVLPQYHHAFHFDDDIQITITPVNHNSSIILEVIGRTTGYMGIGFSLTNSLVGADLVLIWVDDLTGNGHIIWPTLEEFSFRLV